MGPDFSAGPSECPLKLSLMMDELTFLKYLTVIVQTRSIRCLRDLTTAHLTMLRKIRAQVFETVKEKFGVDKNKLRLFVHYHPSYCKLSRTPYHHIQNTADNTDHFHIHVVHMQYEANASMLAGQAHLVDDLISLVSSRLPWIAFSSENHKLMLL